LIAVVIPAHNEEASMAACLNAIHESARCSRLAGEAVLTVVALDSCTDGTGAIARGLGATTVQVNARNVGHARRAGAQVALDAGARWLAFTDADSCVMPGWLSAQLALGCDAVCGTIEVGDWGGYGERMARHFAATYSDRDGHRHIHGANLGVSAQAYQRAGGFEALATSEDVALVKALKRIGASIAWSAAPRVKTSARRHFHAPGGFGDTLRKIEQQQALWAGAAVAGT
jgi:glycosyltransferase involved in cell wall biosynthesis